MMKNYLLSVAIGDIAGSAYEFSNRTKQVDAVNLLHPLRDYTDDTVCILQWPKPCSTGLTSAKTWPDAVWPTLIGDMVLGLGNGYKVRSANLTIVLAMVLPCVVLQPASWCAHRANAFEWRS